MFSEPAKPWFLRHVCSKNVIFRHSGVTNCTKNRREIDAKSMLENSSKNNTKNERKLSKMGSQSRQKWVRNCIKNQLKNYVEKCRVPGGLGDSKRRTSGRQDPMGREGRGKPLPRNWGLGIGRSEDRKPWIYTPWGQEASADFFIPRNPRKLCGSCAEALRTQFAISAMLVAPESWQLPDI